MRLVGILMLALIPSFAGATELLVAGKQIELRAKDLRSEGFCLAIQPSDSQELRLEWYYLTLRAPEARGDRALASFSIGGHGQYKIDVAPRIREGAGRLELVLSNRDIKAMEIWVVYAGVNTDPVFVHLSVEALFRSFFISGEEDQCAAA